MVQRQLKWSHHNFLEKSNNLNTGILVNWFKSRYSVAYLKNETMVVVVETYLPRIFSNYTVTKSFSSQAIVAWEF